ncbi:MAG: LysR family transcriptional regulator [Myxococcales bacterium]|nr:LysR family transcriptional regulator [Myxococcales bacterium]
MTIDLEALAAFLKVAELASFTRAAEQLAMPKARVSARVQALEAELGVRLLQRTTRTVRLTPDGEQLMPRAKQLVIEADELATLFQGSRALRGVVRVDLPVSMARDFVIPRLPEFLAAHPQIELQVSTTDRRVDVVREGFDCVLSVGNLRVSGLVAQRLGELTMVNCASPVYLKKFGLPVVLGDLDRHLLINYEPTFGTVPPAFEYRDGRRYALYPMRSVVTVNTGDSYHTACLAGLGIIQAPRLGLRSLLEDGLLVEILPELGSEPMPVSLVHPHGRKVPKRVRAVMSWLVNMIVPRLM